MLCLVRLKVHGFKNRIRLASLIGLTYENWILIKSSENRKNGSSTIKIRNQTLFQFFDQSGF